MGDKVKLVAAALGIVALFSGWLWAWGGSASEVNTRLANHDEKFKEVEHSVERVEDKIDRRFNKLDAKIDTLTRHFIQKPGRD